MALRRGAAQAVPLEQGWKEGSRAQRDPDVGCAFSLVTFSLHKQRESNSPGGAKPVAQQTQETGDQPNHANTLSTASTNTLGDANSISRDAISTASGTLLPRVMRSPVATSVIR